jgi:hypothetical protein
MAGTGQTILAADFVAIQDEAEKLLGTGVGNKGYGQPVLSADVIVPVDPIDTIEEEFGLIRKSQWDALRYDIINIKYHQTGIVPSIVAVNVGDVVEYETGPASNYNTIIQSATINRFELASSQSVATNRGTVSSSSTWNQSATATVTISFTTVNEARYFFNSGGKIRITSRLTGGSSLQANAWTNFLTTTGTREFGANTDPSVNYYTLTNSYQTYYQNSLSTPYSANNYKLQVKSNSPIEFQILITYTDGYVDPGPSVPENPPPGDLVNGTLSINVEELKASGSMLPSGSFTIQSPLYSISSISFDA